MDREQAWHARALRELMAHQMSGPLRRDHENIDVFRRFDEPEVNRETVSERQILSGAHDWRDFAIVDARRQLIGGKYHDHIGFFRRLPYGQHAQPGLLRLRDGCTRALQPDDDVASRIRQVHGVGVALRSKSDHCNFFVLDVFQIRIFVVINLHGSS